MKRERRSIFNQKNKRKVLFDRKRKERVICRRVDKLFLVFLYCFAGLTFYDSGMKPKKR